MGKEFSGKTETIIDTRTHDFSPFTGDLVKLMDKHKNVLYLARWDDGSDWSYTKVCLDCMHRYTMSHSHSGYRHYTEVKLPDCYGSACRKTKCEEYYSCSHFREIMDKRNAQPMHHIFDDKKGT